VRESEEQLRLAVEAGKMGTWEWNIATNQVKWSPALEAIHGLAPGTFACTFAAYQQDIHPEDLAQVSSAIGQTVQLGEDHQVEYRIIRPDGVIRWVEGRGKLFRDPSGLAVRMIGVCMDITERKRAEEVLRESEQRFRTMADTAPAILWIAESDASCTFLSRGWYEFTGQTEQEALGFGWLEAMHPEDRDATFRILREANARHEPFAVDYRLRRADGVYRWVVDSARPRFGPAGEFLGFIGSVIDMHERKQAEEALREADQRKDAFLATLAHELRNPLAPIRNAVQILRLAEGDRAITEQARQTIERQLQQMVRLVDDLLDLSRITRNLIELRKERVALADVVRSAVETSQPLIDAAGHDLVVTLPPQSVWLNADLVRMAQVVANLLNNAAKYTPERGRIWLTAERHENELVVRVRDTGIGIKLETLPHIFDMFTQVDTSRERSRGGLGIGLTLVKSLVEMHGGSVRAASAGPGQGSEFTVRLPVAAAVEAPRRDGKAGDPSNTKAPSRRILVVDDNWDAAQSLGMLLKIMGHEVRTAYDGAGGLEVVRTFRPDVALLDIGMPGMNGYELARRLRAQDDLRGMILVAVTGWGQEEDRLRSREAGFDLHLTKPADLAALEGLLSSLSVGPEGQRQRNTPVVSGS
jgi:PAS domain S-box-containing protein